MKNKKIKKLVKNIKSTRPYKKRKTNLPLVKNIKPVRPYKKRKTNLPTVEIINSPIIISDIPVVVTNEIPITTDVPVEKKRRGRRSKNPSVNKMYFTQDTEDAIILYNKTEDINIRNDIYNEKIKVPFEKLCECIFNSFKFSYFDVSPLDIQRETVSHLVSNMNKFEAGKGKAFSYFSIIAKHYLIALNNSTYKKRNQHVEIGEEHEENTVQLQTVDVHHKNKETEEFMELMLKFWDMNVTKIFTKQKDLVIAQAIVELFRQTLNISLFNKKALYLYIREISNCSTQNITKIANRMKPYQIKLFRSYINDGIVLNDLYDISKK